MTDLATIADGRYAAARERGRAFMLEHDTDDTTDPHAYHVSTYGAGQRGFLRFRAVCACGWESDPMPRAGLAHAAHDDHAAPTDR